MKRVLTMAGYLLGVLVSAIAVPVVVAGNGEAAGVSILVGFTAATTEAEIAAIATRHGLVLVREFSSIRARQYRLPGRADVEAVLKAMGAEQGVEYAERDQPVRALPDAAEGVR